MSRSGKDYAAAIDSLNRLQTNFSVLDEMKKKGAPARSKELIKEMIEWVRRVGYTPKDIDRLNVLHVTGTKGKGSTCAFTQNILKQYQRGSRTINIKKIGLFTSPHLKTIRERIMINGLPLSEELFAKYFFQVYDRIEQTESNPALFPRLGKGVKPNYFRYLTLLCFHTFISEGVDTAIIEVGIGGEYDSTNVVTNPVACAVTSLGIDHVDVLGDTIESVAWNKAGIFKPSCPAYTIDSQPEEALNVLRKRAEEKGTNLTVVPIPQSLHTIKLGLNGEFQKKNASLAIRLAATRLGIHVDNDLPAEFVIGLETAQWPGRCQVIRRDHVTWYLDGAHTSDSLREAAKWFASTAKQNETILVFNQQKRENVDDLLISLHNNLQHEKIKVCEAYFCTNQSWKTGFQQEMISHNISRDAVEGSKVQKFLAEIWQQLSPETKIHVVSSLEEVVRDIDSHKGPTQVFATGSLLMVGALSVVIDP